MTLNDIEIVTAFCRLTFFLNLKGCAFTCRSAQLSRAWEQNAADLASWGGTGSEGPC